MNNLVIAFDYVLTGKGGQVIDASAKGKPLIFISGMGQIIPGLEAVLINMQPLEKKTVTIEAKEAYEPVSKVFFKIGYQQFFA